MLPPARCRGGIPFSARPTEKGAKMNKRTRLVGLLAAGVAVAATVSCGGGLCKGTGKPD